MGGVAVNVPKPARAWIGYALGLVALCAGVWLEFGVGWALIAGGLVVTLSFLLLYPVDEGKP